MLKKIFSSPLFYPTILVGFCILIAFLNYTPGTFLTGWDTLHPEFNFSFNFSRLFFGVWRPEQGFGAVAGHSHMADLPRVIILWLFHFIFNLSFLRYSYIFLCLILGPLGFYYLIKHLFHGLRITDYGLRNLAFVGALVYLLNFGTVQQFYVPFEMFPTQWAYLPWIILFSLKYLAHQRTSDLFIFAIATLFATPQAYAAHLWYPFFGAYCLFLIIHFTVYRLRFTDYGKLILLTLLINSFWLLPNFYYLKTSSWIPQENQQNRLHSQEFLLKNRQTGNLADSTLIKGFYFDWQIYNFSDQKFQQLMPQWRDHSQNLDVKTIGYFLFFFSCLGLILAFYKKDRLLISLSPFFVIPFILLSNTTTPFNFLFDFLLKIPLLAEILRFVFTKLSILQIFGQSIFFIYLFSHLHQKNYSKIIYFFTITCLLIYTAPIFSGNLISPLIRTKIPNDYFQLWQYMNLQPSGRILALPLHDPSGWIYDSWGYQGSGLIWFGIPQGITDRDNDRWQPVNEEAYREFSTALYSNNPQELKKYLAKYKINYLYWDKNVTTTSPKNQNQITLKYETEAMINQLLAQNILNPPSQFGNLFVYPVSNFSSTVEIGTDLPNLTPSYHWHYFDNIYQNSDYQTDITKPSQFIPFRDILTHFNRLDLNKFDPLKNNLPTTVINPQDIIDQNPNTQISSNSITLHTTNLTQGFNLSFDLLSHQSGYIVGVKSSYLSGIPLRFCFKNTTTNLCLVEDELSKHSNFEWDYFLVPPVEYGFGYDLSFNAISFANVQSLSQIQQITLSPLPDLSDSIINNSTSVAAQNSSFLNQSFYKVNIGDIQNNSTLILNQSFNQDWLAFYFSCTGKPVCLPTILKDHILINNWANGWQLPVTDYQLPITIYIFFYPQLLEFLGFGLLLSTFIWVIKKR